MPRIMPESWHMIQGVGLGLTAFYGWKIGELSLAALPALISWLTNLGSAMPPPG